MLQGIALIMAGFSPFCLRVADDMPGKKEVGRDLFGSLRAVGFTSRRPVYPG